MKTFVVIDVGCIECGEETYLVSTHLTEEEARKSFETYAKSKGANPKIDIYSRDEESEEPDSLLGSSEYFRGGQHSLELHVTPPPEQ